MKPSFSYSDYTEPVGSVSLKSVKVDWQFFNQTDPNKPVKEETGQYMIQFEGINKFIEIPGSPSRVKSFYNFYGKIVLTRLSDSSKIEFPCNRIVNLNTVENTVELTIIPHYNSKITGIAEGVQYSYVKARAYESSDDSMPFILVLLKILFKENKFHKPRCPVCQSLKTIYQDSPKEGELSRETTICPDCTVGTINLYNYTLQQMDFDKPKDQLNTLIQNLYSITENSINMTKNLN